jgi:polysaccharide deacetylase family protein (PEP-CTERM system associated)
MKCILSVDVEDWFHILDVHSSPDISEWDGLPGRIERNFMRMLDIFSENKVKITCFFLGWVAQKYPHLVKEAQSRGHEIASHGFSHKLVYEMGMDTFYEDARESRALLQDMTGDDVLGYRCAGFSVTEETPWFFDCLKRAGYKYDSSMFPSKRGHGGMPTAKYAPYVTGSFDDDVVEFPITVKEVLGQPICFFGGGYLRLFPYLIFKIMATKVLKEHRPVTVYVHPREIDVNSPKLRMNFKRKFKSYVNIKSTEPKIRNILEDFEVVSYREYLRQHGSQIEAMDA